MPLNGFSRLSNSTFVTALPPDVRRRLRLAASAPLSFGLCPWSGLCPIAGQHIVASESNLYPLAAVHSPADTWPISV
ncbi:MAG TPA: hypothetical protein VF074_16635, partial [Pyrinomonadaceae bacterium]